jgi:MFS family permease
VSDAVRESPDSRDSRAPAWRRAGVATGHGIRRLTGAQGAAESGLAKLVELGVLNAMGDAIITIALANTLFFAVPSGQARGRVALYLLVTMVPFVFVAPVIGPFLDRFRTGRRWAMGLALFIRGFLCWVMADAIEHGGWALYPAAFGCLTASKAYIVTRASTVPRLLPERLTLVSANSRISLAGSAGTAAAGLVGGSLAYFGNPAWPLRVGFAVFMAATVLCILLPARADSAEGEQDLEVLPTPGSRRSRPKLSAVAPEVDLALRSNAGLRAAAGLLLIFGAFLLREHPFAGVPAIASAALVGGAAAVGALAGTSLGTVVGSRRPQGVIRIAPVIIGLAALGAAIWYTPFTLAVVGFCAGFSQQAGKLSLDALIQRDVPDANRSSVFAVSETLVQLSWVVGGAIGIVLPLRPEVGLGVIVAVVALTMLALALGRSRQRSGTARGPRAGSAIPPTGRTSADRTTVSEPSGWRAPPTPPPPGPVGSGGWLPPPATRRTED